MAPRHLSAVKDVLDGAVEAPIADARFDGDLGGGGGDGERAAMPPGCPVEPLGTEGGAFYYLSGLGELRELKARDHGNKDLLALFAPFTEFLHDAYPRVDKKGNVTGWRPEEAGEALMTVAASRGVWNAREKVRGRGAWVDEDGRLILHCGNAVLHGGDWVKPGMHGGFVYATAPPVPRLGAAQPPDAPPPGAELLTWLRTWSWARPSVDPMLLLGWIAAAMMGGALKWRPLAWITGDKATGKSTLQEMIAAIFDGGMLSTSDATEAAVRQLLGQQSLPVAIDEAEAEEDNRKLMALIKLARQAASGGRIFRGGQDHQGHEFVARSCFLFSSILVPPIPGQDRSRLAVLELNELPAGAREPRIAAGELRAIGGAMRRRVAERWARWPRVLEQFRDAMIDEGGHGGRTADQFGTLLAAAHLMLVDEDPDDEELTCWAQRLSADTLAERGDDMSDAMRCVYHLGSTLVQLAGHGTPRTVASWVMEASLSAAPIGGDDNPQRAQDMLGKIGMRVFVGTGKGEPPSIVGRKYIAIANMHQGLARQYEGSHWQGRSGASGVWSQSLGRIDGAVKHSRQRIGGQGTACTLIPLEAMIEQDAASAMAEELVDA